MSENRQKWVNLVFLSCSGLVAYVLQKSLEVLSLKFDWEAKVSSIDWILRGTSLFVFVAGAVFLSRWSKTNQYANEAVAELGRVVWPSQKETTNTTIVVLGMVIVSAVIFGIMDLVWGQVLGLILQ